MSPDPSVLVPGPCSNVLTVAPAAQAKGFNHEELEQRVARLEAALAERQKE